jgi:hypothetical protein
MKTTLCLVFCLLAVRAFADGDIKKGEVMKGYDKRFVDTAGRIYTEADPTASGGIAGKIEHVILTHAIAVDHHRLKVFRGEIFDGGEAFRFTGIPVGKYDLVLVTKTTDVIEGLDLGEPTTTLPAASRKNIEVRVSKQDAFFNKFVLLRAGVVDDQAFAFVERLRDNPTVKQSGEALNANVRRLEIITLAKASDDWQQTDTRHIYREPEPKRANHPLLHHIYLPALGNIRVVDSVKQLGTIPLPKN